MVVKHRDLLIVTAKCSLDDETIIVLIFCHASKSIEEVDIQFEIQLNMAMKL